MAKKDKNVSTEGAKEVKETKAKKPAVLKVATLFQEKGVEGAPSRKELAKKILAAFKNKGITHNVKGKEIKEARVLQQISAMVRDIKNKRGEKTGSWWSKYTVEETETEFKLVPIEG